MSPEERNRERRARYKRKKEWQATLDKWAEFAAYMVYLKRQEKLTESR
jgi:hypothetical protein